MNPEIPLLGEIAGLVTALLWSGSSIVFAAATARLGSVQVNLSRLIFAAVFLALTVAIFRLGGPVSASQLANLAISGVVGLAIGDSFLFRAYRDMGPRITMLIMSLSPALAAIFGYLFLGEVLEPVSIAGMALTICGIAVVVLQRNTKGGGASGITGAGIAFALLAALGQAVNLLFAKAALNEGPLNGFHATLIRILASLAVLAPVMLLSKRWRNPIADFRRDRLGLILTIAGSILGPFLGISFSLIAVANTSVAVASTLMATVPILMLPLVRIVHRERLTWRAIGGACIAVSGVALLFLR
jgi:drug/metabolite transporter (DMT)-like permease